MGPPFIQSHPKDRHPHPTVGIEPGTQGYPDLCASALTTAPCGLLGYIYSFFFSEYRVRLCHLFCSNEIFQSDTPVGGNMDLSNIHADLIDLGAKGKLDAICNAMTFFKHDNE
jgi:hypothetical protein